MDVAATVAPKGLAKKLVHWVDLLGQPFPRKLVLITLVVIITLGLINKKH